MAGTGSKQPPDGPRWLTAAEMAAWRGFVENYADLVSAVEADLARDGLTLGDYQVLVYLSEASEATLRMCDLAAMLQLTPSGLTRRLDGLVRAGLVARRSSDLDRRVTFAELTAAGRERLVAAAPAHVESVRTHMIDLLDAGELAALASAFAKVRGALRSDAAAGPGRTRMTA